MLVFQLSDGGRSSTTKLIFTNRREPSKTPFHPHLAHMSPEWEYSTSVEKRQAVPGDGSFGISPCGSRLLCWPSYIPGRHLSLSTNFARIRPLHWIRIRETA